MTSNIASHRATSVKNYPYNLALHSEVPLILFSHVMNIYYTKLT